MTQHSTLPTTKREKLCYLLDHWDDIFDPNAISMQGSPGDGTNTPHLGPMSHHPSVIELMRCLDVLHREAPVQLAHLKAYHCCEWRVVRTAKFKSIKGRWAQIANPRSDHEEDWDRKAMPIRPAWVREHKVELAERRLIELFRGPVFIPEELWDALTKSSAEIEAKRRRQRAGSGRMVAA